MDRTTLWILVPAMGLLAAPLAAQEGKPVPLPADPEAVVISLDQTGGFTPMRVNEAPFLSIRADGTIQAVEPFARIEPVTARLSADELQALLAFVIQEEEFLAIDPAALRKALASQAGDGLVIMDAATTVIRVATRDGSHQVEQNALEFMAREHPGIPELQRLEAVRRRLERVRSVVLAGGPEATARFLEHANARLAEQHQDVAALSLEDLRGVSRQPDGRLRLRFQRNDGAVLTSASIQVSPEGEETIAIDRAYVK